MYYEDVTSIGAKYDLANQSNLRGAGIWALGYDDGPVAMRYQRRRAARSLATSSKRSSVVAKWKDSRGANRSKASPRPVSSSQ